MFSQSADQPATDESTAPAGMRELPPQPAKPVMPAYDTTTLAQAPQPQPAEAGPGPDDDDVDFLLSCHAHPQYGRVPRRRTNTATFFGAHQQGSQRASFQPTLSRLPP